MKQRRSWTNRIVGHDVVPAEDLLANPDNWRIHPRNQQNVMEGILDEVGWLDEVKVSRNSGVVIDGHMRVAIAISKGETVPIAYLDLTPEEEALALATFNPIGSLAVPDEQSLNEVLGKVATDNPEITEFLDGLYSEVSQTGLKTAGDGEESADGDSGGGSKTPAAPTVRMLMQVPEIAVMEQAILRTGEATRGAAMLRICKEWLEHGHAQTGKSFR